MSTENDLIRIRQWMQKLQAAVDGADGDDGLNVFITYHASDLDSTPSNPTGDGTTGGWHRTFATGDNWMSTKTALLDTQGTWSNPIAIRGLPGENGDDAVVYYIKPTDGTAIHNSTGTLTIEAHKIAGGSDTLLSSGTIKLYDPNNNEVTEANGYATGSDGYTGVLDSGDIDGSKVITLKDGTEGTPLDTITLVDVQDGVDGGGLSDDVPFLTGITFIGNTGSGKVGWTAGTLDFGGTPYNIVAKAVDDGSTDTYIYWDDDDSTTTFKTTDDLATAIAAGNWVVCVNNSGAAIPAATHKVVLAGVIKTSTLAAINADLGNITAGQLKLSGLDGSPTTEALARYQIKLDGTGLYGRWRGSALPAWSDTESGSGTSYNSGWRKIIDISGNEVHLSFDSYDTGESVGLDSDDVIAYREKCDLYHITTSTSYVDYDSASFTLDGPAIEVDFDAAVWVDGGGNELSVVLYVKNQGGTKVWESTPVSSTALSGNPDTFTEHGINLKDEGIPVAQTYKVGIALKRTTGAGNVYASVQGWWGRAKCLSIIKS